MPIEHRNTEFLTTRDAAKYLSVSETTLRAWAIDGHITFQVTPGGHRRYRREDLDKVMKTVEANG